VTVLVVRRPHPDRRRGWPRVFRFSPARSSSSARDYVALVALGWLAFVKPLMRRVTDSQVALYLEEHEPALDAVLVSAVDARRRLPAARPRRVAPHESAALLRRLVESAIERCEEIDLGRGIERRVMRRLAVTLTAIARRRGGLRRRRRTCGGRRGAAAADSRRGSASRTGSR